MAVNLRPKPSATIKPAKVVVEPRVPPKVPDVVAPAVPETKGWVAKGPSAKPHPTSVPGTPVAASAGQAKVPAQAGAVSAAPPRGGLKTQPDSGLATVERPMTVRELAATAYGLPVDQIGDAHLGLVLSANPELHGLDAAAQIPRGTTVSLEFSPRVIERERKAVLGGINTIDEVLRASRRGEGQLTPEMMVQLGQTRRELVDRAKALDAQLPLLRTYEGIGTAEHAAAGAKTAVEVTTAYSQAKTAAAALKDTAGASAGAQVARSEVQALVRVATQQLQGQDSAAAVATTTTARTRLDDALTNPKLTGEQRASLLQQRAEVSIVEAQAHVVDPAVLEWRRKNPTAVVSPDHPLPPAVAKALADAQGKITTAYGRATSDLAKAASAYRELARAAPAAGRAALETSASRLEGAAKDFNAKSLEGVAQLNSIAGDSRGQLAAMEQELATRLGTPGAKLLQAGEQKSVSSEGKETDALHLFSWLGSTNVGFLTPTQLQSLGSRLDKLDGAERDKALEVVSRYAEAGANGGDPTALNVARQVLQAQAKKDPKGPWAAHAATTEASFLLQAGNSAGARDAYRTAAKLSSQVADPQARQGFEARAVMGEAAALAQLARNGSYGDRYPAAQQLRQLRERVEKQGGPLDRDSTARLALTEMQAFLGPNKAADAEKTLAHVRSTYGDVPWMKAALNEFEAKNRDGGVVAFLQVLGSEAASATAAENMSVAAGGAAVGAGVGVWFFGVGAVPGAMIGAGVASGGLLLRNLVRGAGNVVEAGQSGLNRQTAMDSVGDAVSVASDIASIVAPLKAAGLVGKAGLRAAAGATDDAAQLVIKSNLLALERQMGTEQFVKLTKDEATEAAKKVILKQFSNTALAAGGVAIPAAGLTLTAGNVASQWVDIERSDMTAAQKKDARARLFGELGKSVLQSLPSMAMQTVLQRAAVSGVPAELQDAVAKTASMRTGIKVVDDAAYAAQLKQAAADEIKVSGLTGADADRVRAHYDAIAARGSAYFDPVGNIYISNAAAKSGEAAEILRHEVAHRDFNALSFPERQRLVKAFESDPNREAIRKQVAAANPHAGGFTPMQIIDEYQSMTRAKVAAGGKLDGVSPTFDRALQDAGLKGVKDVDLKKLLDHGSLQLKQTLPQSGARMAMGESGVEDLKWNGYDWDEINTDGIFEDLQYSTQKSVKTMSDAFEPDAIRVINEVANQAEAGKTAGTLASLKSQPQVFERVANLYGEARNAKGITGPWKMSAGELRAALGLASGAAGKYDVAKWFSSLTATKAPVYAGLKEQLESGIRSGKLKAEALVGIEDVLNKLESAPTGVRDAALHQLRSSVLAEGLAPDVAASRMKALGGKVETLSKTSLGKAGALSEKLLAGSVTPEQVKALAGYAGLDPLLTRARQVPGLEARLHELAATGVPAAELEKLSKVGAVLKRTATATDAQIAALKPGLTPQKHFESHFETAGIPPAIRDQLYAAGVDGLEELTSSPTVVAMLTDGKRLPKAAEVISIQAQVAAEAKTAFDAKAVTRRLELADRAIAMGVDAESAFLALRRKPIDKGLTDVVGPALTSLANRAGSLKDADEALRAAFTALAGGGGPLPSELKLGEIIGKVRAAGQPSYVVEALENWQKRYSGVPR